MGLPSNDFLKIRHPLLIALLLLVLHARAASGAVLEVTLRHVFNGDAMLPDSLRYENAAHETLSVERLSYLLSGFALEREDGVWVELPESIAWMDAARRRTTVRFADVPDGKYCALRFHLGPDATANSAEPGGYSYHFARTPNRARMFFKMRVMLSTIGCGTRRECSTKPHGQPSRRVASRICAAKASLRAQHQKLAPTSWQKRGAAICLTADSAAS